VTLPPMNLWSRNINNRGRIIRIGGGLAFLAAALVAGWNGMVIPTVILGISAAFMLYEGARGWCALRACGVKTPF
jgi:hypothetical protein